MLPVTEKPSSLAVAAVGIDEHFTAWLPVLAHALSLKAHPNDPIGFSGMAEASVIAVKRGLISQEDVLGHITNLEAPFSYNPNEDGFIASPVLYHLKECIQRWFRHNLSWRLEAAYVNELLIGLQKEFVKLNQQICGHVIVDSQNPVGIDYYHCIRDEVEEQLYGAAFRFPPELKARFPEKGLR